MRGEGPWQATQIATSLAEFGVALDAVADIAKGRENPMALENNPLTQTERQKTLSLIRSHNPDAAIDFWESLLS